jgi:hypothetical protein
MRYDPSKMLIILSMLRFSMFWIVPVKIIFRFKQYCSLNIIGLTIEEIS